MQLSRRITSLTDDGAGGWGVFYRARRMVEDGQEITQLTIGEHDIPTDPAILQAMHKSAMGGHTGYAAVPGVAKLRRAVAQRVEAQTGVPTTPANVMITPGGQAALFAAHMAVCDAGDRALYLDPYYATYPGTIRSAGATPVPVTTRPQDAFEPREEDLRASANGARSLLINSPNNPTGVVYSRQTIEGVARVCRDHDLWLISDEVYDTQIWEGHHISPRSLDGMTERTLVIGSMSKSHAMTGSRVGWVVGPEDLINCLIELAVNTTYGVPGYIQDGAYFALQQGPALERAIAEPFRRRRALGTALTGAQNLVGLIPSAGAMYMMLDIRATGLSGEEFANRLLDERAIAVMPGESFGKAAAGHIRVAMTVSDAAFETALQTLLKFAHHIAKKDMNNGQ